ncbi:MAG TPA: hypothetical protein VHO70_08640 [Chitinispirillaceae bacterium]|nr:hypothetical protein [Chitinispirillaceae bacterium]
MEVSVSVYKGKNNLLDILNTGWAAFMRGSAEWPAMLFTDVGFGNMHSAAVDFGLTMNDNKYAYAWFLTGVTGPDFIDMNNNGTPDDGDFGYWVKINYSETPDVAAYEWREPV